MHSISVLQDASMEEMPFIPMYTKYTPPIPKYTRKGSAPGFGMFDKGRLRFHVCALNGNSGHIFCTSVSVPNGHKNGFLHSVNCSPTEFLHLSRLCL